jgi:transposase-like protein
MNDPALAIPYLTLWAAMMRALLVRAQILPATCNRCGRPYERHELGETVCSCSRV